MRGCVLIYILTDHPPKMTAPHDGQDDDTHREPKEFRLSMAGKNRKEIVGPPFR